MPVHQRSAIFRLWRHCLLSSVYWQLRRRDEDSVTDRPTGSSTNRPTDRSINQSINQSINRQPIIQSTNQPTNQTTNQPATLKHSLTAYGHPVLPWITIGTPLINEQ
jgi:hypothetical protein